MKTEKTSGRKPALLRRSIAARIMLIVFLILLGIMCIMGFYMRSLISYYVREYHTAVGELISALTSQEIGFYLDDMSRFKDTEEVDNIYEQCRKQNIYSLWVETSEPPYDEGVNQLYLPVADEIRDVGWDSREHKTYPLGEQEKELFSGRSTSAVYEFKGTHGQNIISYLHGIYDDNGTCIAVIGVNFDIDVIKKDIRGSASRMSVIVIITFAALMSILGIFFHYSIFGPIGRISAKMRKYADGGQLDTVRLDVKGEDELSRMAASYNEMTDEINVFVKKVSTLENDRARAEVEMKVAAQIQKGMIPPARYSVGPIRIEAMIRPAKEVAGDFYDYFTLPDGRIFICIADVSGKGIAAALFMSEAADAIRYNAAIHPSLAQAMYAANNDLCARNPETLFVTAFAAIYDPASGLLTWCSAGHNPVYLAGAGSVTPLSGADCLLLGVFPDENYTESSVSMKPGDTLFLYTDGLTEARDPGGEMFGTKRMESMLRQYISGDKQRSLVSMMTESVNSFENGAEAFDDLTMMSMGVNNVNGDGSQ